MSKILCDGTNIADLIDREAREIDQRVLNDAEIHRLEMQGLFAKAWVIVGHESEIPKVGDFVTRHLGEDPVIVVHARSGEVECLLNACTHRGALVCREESGNSAVLRCIYHGWVFSLDGSFRGAPFQKELFPQAFDASRLGLRKARVAVFCGIIFACWDEQAPALAAYLGDFAWYLKAIFGRADYEVLGPPHRFVQRANWKTASEQFAGDAYHASQLHRSLSELVPLDRNDPGKWSLLDPKVGTDEGHTALCFSLSERIRRASKENADKLSPLERLTLLPPPGMTKEQVPEMAKRFSPEELDLLSRNPPSQCAIFPNSAIWSNTAPLPDGRTFSSFLSLRTYIPMGPDKFEFLMWTFVAKGTSEAFREDVRTVASFGQGAVGFVEQDDAEVWPGMTDSARGPVGGRNKLRYFFKGKAQTPPNWPAGGYVYSGYSSDDTQWHWWSRYFDFLQGSAKGYVK